MCKQLVNMNVSIIACTQKLGRKSFTKISIKITVNHFLASNLILNKTKYPFDNATVMRIINITVKTESRPASIYLQIEIVSFRFVCTSSSSIRFNLSCGFFTAVSKHRVGFRNNLQMKILAT